MTYFYEFRLDYQFTTQDRSSSVERGRRLEKIVSRALAFIKCAADFGVRILCAIFFLWRFGVAYYKCRRASGVESELWLFWWFGVSTCETCL